MTAVCKCEKGHSFNSRVVEYSPDINYFEIEDTECPECGAAFDVLDVEVDHWEDDVF